MKHTHLFTYKGYTITETSLGFEVAKDSKCICVSKSKFYAKRAINTRINMESLKKKVESL